MTPGVSKAKWNVKRWCSVADYYPLLDKAVSSLKTSTRESRRTVYERARKAMLGHLRSMQPPMPESAIDCEAQALEEAIARLERVLFLFPPVAATEPPVKSELSGSIDRPGKLNAFAYRLRDWAKAKASRFRKKRMTKKLLEDLAAAGFETEHL